MSYYYKNIIGIQEILKNIFKSKLSKIIIQLYLKCRKFDVSYKMKQLKNNKS